MKTAPGSPARSRPLFADLQLLELQRLNLEPALGQLKQFTSVKPAQAAFEAAVRAAKVLPGPRSKLDLQEPVG